MIVPTNYLLIDHDFENLKKKLSTPNRVHHPNSSIQFQVSLYS